MRSAFLILLFSFLLVHLNGLLASPVHKHQLTLNEMLSDEPSDLEDGEVLVRCTRTTCPWRVEECARHCMALGFVTGSSSDRDCTCYRY